MFFIAAYCHHSINVKISNDSKRIAVLRPFSINGIYTLNYSFVVEFAE
jgi:hypothetical protein